MCSHPRGAAFINMISTPKDFRIALISTGLGHVNRGIETWTEDLGQELHALGADVTVYKGAGKKDRPYEKVIPCLQRMNPLSQWVIKYRPGFLWRFGFSSGYTLEEMTFNWNIFPELVLKQYDIIHTQDPQVADFWRKVSKLGLIRSKIILAHGTEEPFEFLGKFDYLQHLAPYHLQEARAAGCKKTGFAIGNFVDIESFKPGASPSLRKELNIPANAFVVLSVAAIKRTHKRIDHLIKEVAQIRNENIFLVVAGAAEQESEEVIALGKEQLGNRCIFLKNFPRTRIHEVFAMANVFVLCSLKEMMPIALLEATASGLPAIIHTYPVEEWMTGEGGDPIDMTAQGELSRTIIKYLDHNYRKDKAAKARAHTVEHFSKEKIVQEIIQMYAEVAS